jgi:hypothetical protein
MWRERKEYKMPDEKATRRKNNEGTIYQRKDGMWCGQVLTGYDERGKPIRKTIYAERQQGVTEKIHVTAYRALSGNLPDSLLEKITLECAFEEYLWTFLQFTAIVLHTNESNGFQGVFAGTKREQGMSLPEKQKNRQPLRPAGFTHRAQRDSNPRPCA